MLLPFVFHSCSITYWEVQFNTGVSRLRKIILITGKVKWYNNTLGYGFLTPDEGEDIFVHFSALQGIERLEIEDRVRFDVGEGPKGPMAVNVTKA